MDTDTFARIRADEQAQLELTRDARARLTAKRERSKAMRPRVAGHFVFVPLANAAGRVKIRGTAHRRLKDGGYTGTGWVFDEESGCIRCRKIGLPKEHPDKGMWFDVGALLLGLRDGEKYQVDDPLDLTTLRAAR